MRRDWNCGEGDWRSRAEFLFDWVLLLVLKLPVLGGRFTSTVFTRDDLITSCGSSTISGSSFRCVRLAAESYSNFRVEVGG